MKIYPVYERSKNSCPDSVRFFCASEDTARRVVSELGENFYYQVKDVT